MLHDIELRFIEIDNPPDQKKESGAGVWIVPQWRKLESRDFPGGHTAAVWTEWKDVPLVKGQKE